MTIFVMTTTMTTTSSWTTTIVTIMETTKATNTTTKVLTLMLQHRWRGAVRPRYRGRVCSLWESLLHLHQADPGGGQLYPQTANYPPRPQGILNSPSRFFYPLSPRCSILLNLQLVTFQPENILCLTKSGNRIKIIDFGLARRFEPMKKLQILFGTPEFVAPEVFFFFILHFLSFLYVLISYNCLQRWWTLSPSATAPTCGRWGWSHMSCEYLQEK